MWGFAGSPLVDGDRLICVTPKKGALVTAFDKRTGDVRWAALSAPEPGYAPPIVCEAAGRRQLIVWHPQSVNSLDPETGKVFWTVPFGPVEYGVSIMTPRFHHDPKLGDVLMVSSQREGAMVLRLGKGEDGRPKADVLWSRKGRSDRNTDALHVMMATPVVRDGLIFGVDARGRLRCLDLATGDRLWETQAATTYDQGPQPYATTFLVPLGDAGGRFLLPNEHGDLILADLTRRGYAEVGRAHLLDPTNSDAGRPALWSHPAFASGCLLWRNDRELVCVPLTPEAGKAAAGGGGAGRPPPRPR